MKGLCKKRQMNCQRLYTCQPATKEETAERFNLSMEHQMAVILNRLRLACSEFFNSGGTKGKCTQERGDRVARGLQPGKLVIKGEGKNFTATVSGGWKDMKGKDQKRVFQLDYKGEFKRLDPK